jgi:hypothetical protein
MTLEKRIEKRFEILEERVGVLEDKADNDYADIGNILRFLRIKYPQDFQPGGQFKPGLFPQE